MYLLKQKKNDPKKKKRKKKKKRCPSLSLLSPRGRTTGIAPGPPGPLTRRQPRATKEPKTKTKKRKTPDHHQPRERAARPAATTGPFLAGPKGRRGSRGAARPSATTRPRSGAVPRIRAHPGGRGARGLRRRGAGEGRRRRRWRRRRRVPLPSFLLPLPPPPPQLLPRQQRSPPPPPSRETSPRARRAGWFPLRALGSSRAGRGRGGRS